jgi:hypothetical protein
MQKIFCEICGVDGFKTNEECAKHEKSCKGELKQFVCELCGNKTTYYETKKFSLANEVIKAQCHILKGIANYGSQLEGEVELHCCDKCLVEKKKVG